MPSNIYKRNQAFRSEFYKRLQSKHLHANIFSRRIIRETLASPAPSFFIDEETARNYIYMFEKNLLPKTELRRALFRDLYQAYLRVAIQHPQLSKYNHIALAAASPAPRFYISEAIARKIIYSSKYANS